MESESEPGSLSEEEDDSELEEDEEEELELGDEPKSGPAVRVRVRGPAAAAPSLFILRARGGSKTTRLLGLRQVEVRTKASGDGSGDQRVARCGSSNSISGCEFFLPRTGALRTFGERDCLREPCALR